MSEGVKGRAWNGNRANFDLNLAVVIGIDLYENPSIRNLSTAVSDASAIADLLEQQYAYKHSDEKPEVIRLFDEEATLDALQHLFHTRIPEELNPGEGDRLIIYYAGHGLPRSNDDGPEGYLVPHDADSTKPELFLAMRDVSAALSKLKCHHLLVILDCCFAGTFRWAGSRKAVPILETIRREHYYHFIRHPAWQVITSSAHDQEALDVARLKEDNRKPVPGLDTPHSPFALAILEGLQTGDDSQRANADLYPDGVVTAHELFVYLQNRVKELSGERQNPGIFPLRQDYDKGEFIFTAPGFDPQKLAEALPLNEDNNPYRGLNSFDEKHAAFFFGRQALIEELAKRLSKPDQALTVVLGVSGSGKSSLVKAGLMPQLRSHQTEQNTEQWRILDPMRPGALPFTSLARTLLPIFNEGLLEQLAQVSFLDVIFQLMLKAKAESDKNSNRVALVKIAESWCGATPEAKLLLIEDYFAQLATLGNPQQQEQLKSLHDRILAELDVASQHLQQEPHTFSRVIATWSQNHPGVRLLLVIDQLEELLTRSQDDSAKQLPYGNRESPSQTEQKKADSTEQKEWQQFLEVLRIAIVEHTHALRLVLTLRSDFEPRFLTSALEPYWKDARFPIRAMISDELRQAIENPALKQALYFEELKDEKGNTTGNLVSKLVDEVGQMPGALPLLSFTLSELYVRLYKRWEDPTYTGRTFLFEDYESLGGVAGALTRRATEEYDALDKQHQDTMRRVMLRMVAIEGAGVARRRVPESELVYPSLEENERVKQVIDLLVKARLLVKGQETGEPYVEPAHDFLVRGWDQLQEWIKNKEDNPVLQQRLTVAANDWRNKSEQEKEHKTLLNIVRQAETFVICKVQDWRLDRERCKQRKAESSNRSREKSIQYLWDDDPRLEELKRILIRNNWFNRTEDSFVRKSLIEQRRNTYRFIEIATTVGLGLVVLTIAALYQAQLSSLREKAAVVTNRLSTDAPIDGLILAIDATGQNRFWLPWNMLSPVQSSLLAALEEARESNRFTIEGQDRIAIAAFSPNGKYIATGDGINPRGNPGQKPINGTIWLRDLQGKPISKPMPHGGGVEYITFSPDGKYIASRDLERIVKVWDLQGNLIKKESSFDNPFSYSDSVNVSINNKKISFLQSNSKFGDIDALSIDSNYIATVKGLTNLITVQNKNSQQDNDQQKFTTLRGCQGSIQAIKFSQDNRYITGVCSDKTIRIWELQSGSVISTPPLNRGSTHEFARSFTFSTDSQSIISGHNDGIIRIVDLTGKKVHSFRPTERGIDAIAVSPNGNYIVAAAAGMLYLWDSKGNPIGNPLKGHSQKIESVAFSSDSKLIVSGSFDETIKIWNLEGENTKTIDLTKRREVYSVKLVSFSLDNRYVVAGISDEEYDLSGKVYLLDIADDSNVKPFGDDWRFALSPKGKHLAIRDENNTIQLWNMSGQRIGPLFRGHTGKINSLSFSYDGHFIASGSSDNTVRLWDIEGNLITTFYGHQGSNKSVNFSPDSQYIASLSDDKTIRLLPSNWKSTLQAACNRLQHHPVLTNPKTDEEKSAARTCLSYGRMDRQ